MIALHRHLDLASPGSARSGGGMLTAAARQIGRWIDRHRQRRELLGLSDHMLKDVGLSRADAYREAGKHFWQA